MTKKITPIKKVLVANRGEIAVRIMRTCRDLGIQTVAVYSEADRTALHVQVADEAYCIGPAVSAESYLKIPNIIQVAKKSGADAIHPGYGFLSEKADFSRACEEAGIIFLGPRPEPIERMGNKIEARKIAEKAGVPMVPGLKRGLTGVDEAKKLAAEIGYPVLLKAAAGGGGKGMRVVEKEADIEQAYERATSEAMKAFNDGEMYIEKYLREAHHIEIQILCDKHGNGIHLYERECSLQRRHQKVIEEAPALYIKPETRDKMTKSALSLAKEVGYSGVGTLEFMVDHEQNFYFLEMNTRLQVEHPVTEMITGLDLVQLQIEVGEGRELSLKQEDVKIRGHALECRLYAEDPENNFMPSPGTIQWMTVPEGPGVRIDAGVYEGATIPIYYDPIISKLIVWGNTREQAIRRMKRALRDYEVGGFRNNIPFLKTLVEDPSFENLSFHTRYIDNNPALMKRRKPELPEAVIFALAALDKVQSKSGASLAGASQSSQQASAWKVTGLRDSLSSRF